jgi:transposase
VLVDGLSQLEAARRLSLSNKTLANWVRAARKGTLTEVGKQQRPLNELESEVARLKRELAVVTMERDVLKNRPTRLRAPLMSRNSRGVHSMRAETVAVRFFGGMNPVKKPGPGEAADSSVAASSDDPV